MESNLRNSKCMDGWLHRYEVVAMFETGALEICEICRDRQFFHNKIPNHIYLSYHLRSTLQPYDGRFRKEYNK